ncbi:uncharacterized protein BBOV_IV007040 [Babesia bovis T2Bo]|uniref:Thioredoxin domain-containing protein n=1 Tax=Babesia bovis TaxID=5865 RepID=A7AR91_BABBO|nr:uncharacterized protein BBOV_IV007040 [Babesia bovis T2Bo]EDO07060.1 hypothetical protein BBOV_IV007040 [Babesia bovis T2Bo]|eukprot:XP_001610628.1 hypothetical protein [Babesia bovis T2Bo]
MWSRGIFPFTGVISRYSCRSSFLCDIKRNFCTTASVVTHQRSLRNVLKLSSVCLVGTGLYYYYGRGNLPFLFSIPLEHIDEEKFDGTDNVVVVLLGGNRRKHYPRRQIELLQSIVPKGVRICYTVKEGGDYSNPPAMLYKGMRKQFYGSLDLTDKSQFDALKADMIEFFQPVSQDYSKLHQDTRNPEFVTYNTFQERVVREATPRAPIVLQLYEKGCFLCFLMRPFINSVNRHLQEIKSPVRIKRLDIESNDFPSGCPITRATPTFVLFNGRPTGDKWSEFKPRDFVRKLAEIAHLDSRSQSYLESLTDDVSRRFALFGRWAHWVSQSQSIQERVLTGQPVNEDEIQSRVLNSLMLLDMERHDDLESNLKGLHSDITSAEQDCLAVVQVMADEILRSERGG